LIDGEEPAEKCKLNCLIILPVFCGGDKGGEFDYELILPEYMAGRNGSHEKTEHLIIF
jgi:hypothetical protein